MIDGFSGAFGDVEFAESDVRLEVSGNIPLWLRGSLRRIGPGRFGVNRSRVRHWFDGFSHVIKFDFREGGEVYLSNNFLQSEAYKKSLSSGSVTMRGFGTNPISSWQRWVCEIFTGVKGFFVWPYTMPAPPYSDNCNVNFVPYGGNMVALTEVAKYIEFNSGLDTLGSFEFLNRKKGVLTTAHPSFDSNDRSYINVLYHPYVITRVQVVKQDFERKRYSVLRSFFRVLPSYVHSVTSTENYAIYIEHPLRFFAPLFLFPGSTFLRLMSFSGRRKTVVNIIDKRSGENSKFKIDPFFFFHIVNAFEEGDVLTLELPTFRNAKILKQLGLCAGVDVVKNLDSSSYSVCNFNLRTGECNVRMEASPSIELPRINENFTQKRHRFVYGVNMGSGCGFRDVVKFDTISKKVSKFCVEGRKMLFGEPVFVQDPGACDEDGGILLSLAIDEELRKSILYGIDAKEMREAFSCDVGRYFPLGFHGHFVPIRSIPA